MLEEAKISYEPTEEEEEIQGSQEFNFWHCIYGALFDLKGLADEINAATNAAYGEEIAM